MNKKLIILCALILTTACNGSTFSIDQESSVTDLFPQSENQTPETDSDEFTLLLDSAAVYPTADGLDAISSPFGPRLKASDNDRYDFHRGIDIPGDDGEAIFAVADGTLYAAYFEGSEAYPNGGNVVIIQHELATPITFHDTTITRYYTVYMHLSAFGQAAQNYLESGGQDQITQGDTIGTMGSTGDTDFTHLHFEVRLQTPCSFEYQTSNPASSCSGYGFDPHVNPLSLYFDDFDDETPDISFVSGSNSRVTVRVTAPDSDLIVDGVKLLVYSSAERTALLHELTLSYNQRLGFDASSTETLDNSELTGVTISPASFKSTSSDYQIDFRFDLDPNLWENHDTLYLDATLITLFGETELIRGALHDTP